MTITVPVDDRGEMSEETFREQARSFLSVNAARRGERSFEWGVGSDAVGLYPNQTAVEEQTELALGRQWRAKVFDAGFGWITGPQRYGGRGLPYRFEQIWQEELRSYDTPPERIFSVGLGMVGPTILHHGSEELRRQYLRGIYRTDVVCCQLFSEPEAGSDLANLRTTAVRDGDEWVVNGQKVWTSSAHLAQIGELLCRTNPEAPRYRGLSVFLIDMSTPGIDVRPLRQMTGGSTFNEVFFRDVRIPDSRRIGDVDDGWRIAMSTLTSERSAIAGGNNGSATVVAEMVQRLIMTARHLGRDREPVIRDALAKAVVDTRVMAMVLGRFQAESSAGKGSGAKLSIGKLFGTQIMDQIAHIAELLLGPSVVADSGEWGTFAWSEFVLSVRGKHVGGGTDQVQRNALAERVLGLPKDRRPESR